MTYSEAGCFLTCFGKLTAGNVTLSADDVFDLLFDARRWYLPRTHRATTVASLMIFYQNGRGARGSAKVARQRELGDRFLLPSVFRSQFTVSLVLQDCVRFESAVSLKELIDQLDFITDKRYWGQSLRSSPRPISLKDFKTILTAASKRDTSG